MKNEIKEVTKMAMDSLPNLDEEMMESISKNAPLIVETTTKSLSEVRESIKDTLVADQQIATLQIEHDNEEIDRCWEKINSPDCDSETMSIMLNHAEKIGERRNNTATAVIDNNNMMLDRWIKIGLFVAFSGVCILCGKKPPTKIKL